MIEVINSIINQKGTPAFYTDVLAKRPAYGYTGRIFISSDTKEIYEDTGTAWQLIGSGSVGASSLEAVTTIGNTTDKGIVISAGAINATGLNVLQYTDNAYTGLTDYAGFVSLSTTFGTTAPTTGNSLASNNVFANYTFNNSLTINNSTPIDGASSSFQFNVAASQSISFTQVGSNFRGLSGYRAAIINTNGTAGTLSHATGLLIQGIYAPGSTGTITNYYGLNINDSNEYGFSARATNKYGIAQRGASDFNYFLGNTALGTTTNTGVRLYVNGDTTVAGILNPNNTANTINGSISGAAYFSYAIRGSYCKKIMIYCNSLNGTATYNFPTGFLYIPAIITTNQVASSVVTSLSTSSVTITGATTTGFIILEGF